MRKVFALAMHFTSNQTLLLLMMEITFSIKLNCHIVKVTDVNTKVSKGTDSFKYMCHIIAVVGEGSKV